MCGMAVTGAWLAMVVTFVLCLGLAYWVVAVTRKTWDYLVTASTFHFVVCCIGEARAASIFSSICDPFTAVSYLLLFALVRTLFHFVVCCISRCIALPLNQDMSFCIHRETMCVCCL